MPPGWRPVCVGTLIWRTRQQRGLSVCFRRGLTMQPAIRLPVAILFFALHSPMHGEASFVAEVCTFEKEATNDESVRLQRQAFLRDRPSQARTAPHSA